MNPFPQSIAVIGAGALGSYYGAKLARQGADVRFLMRADLDAVRRDGVRVREQGGEGGGERGSVAHRGGGEACGAGSHYRALAETGLEYSFQWAVDRHRRADL